MAEKENKQEMALQTVAAPQNSGLVFDTLEHFEAAQRMGQCLVTSNMLPDQFKGQGNLGNVMIALEIANRGHLPVMEVFQNLYIVKGKTGWGSSYLIGRVNAATKRFTGLRWEFDNEEAPTRCRAYSYDANTGEKLTGSWVSLEMAKREGWGQKWQTMPEQMLRYRSAAFWVRTFAPDIAMGIPMSDEIQDIPAQEMPAPTPEEIETRKKRNTAAKDALAKGLGLKKKDAVTAVVVEEAKPAESPATEQAPAPAQEQAAAPERDDSDPFAGDTPKNDRNAPNFNADLFGGESTE